MVTTKTPGLLGAKLPLFCKQRSSKSDISSGGRATVVAVKLVFLDRFLKNVQISNPMKMSLWEPSCSIRTDRRVVITKLQSLFAILRRRLKRNSLN